MIITLCVIYTLTVLHSISMYELYSALGLDSDWKLSDVQLFLLGLHDKQALLEDRCAALPRCAKPPPQLFYPGSWNAA